MADSSTDPILNEVRLFFDNLATYRLIGWMTTPLRSTPWWLRCLAFALLTVVIYGPLTIIFAPDLLPGVLAAGLLIFISLVAARVVANQTLDILETEILADRPASPAQSQTLARLPARCTMRRQIVVAASLTALLVALVVPVSIRVFTGILIILWGIAATMLLFFFFNLMYFFLVITLTILDLTREGYALYPLDPRQSTFVHGATSITRQMVWLISILSAFGTLITPLVVTEDLAQALLLTGAAFIMVLVAVFGMYYVQQYHLSRLVARQKSATLSSLQARIQELYANVATLNQEDRQRLDALISLHDQVASRKERAINFAGALRFLAPLLLPLLSLGINTLNLPFNSTIIQLLEQVLN